MKEFKILALDGGGVRGLFSSRVLQEIESANGSIAEHFDMLCGNSTGGLIALALATGKSAAEVVEFYQRWLPKIFPAGKLGRFWRDKFRFYLWKGKYTDKNLRRAAREVLGEACMRESNSYLCIPSVNLTTASPYVFKTDHDPTLTRDSGLLMSDVALATSAAPFYFPVANSSLVPGGEYIDGGLWANNPALVGLIEACRFFAGPAKPYATVRILSVPAISPTVGYTVGKRRGLSIRSFAKAITDVTFETQQKATGHFINMIASSLNVDVTYVRVQPPNVSAEIRKHLGLDIATKHAMDLLMNFGYSVGQEYNTRPEVIRFFEEKAPKPIFRTTEERGKAHVQLS
jgi:hypothetical protein